MKLSKESLATLSLLEGFRGSRYKDQAGLWTIGFGHLQTPSDERRRVSREEALADLAEDVKIAEEGVTKYVTIPLTQNEFDALVIFVFNVGVGAFRRSGTLRVINSGKKEEVPSWLGKWVYVTMDGVKLRSDGLVNRREKEIEIWNQNMNSN